MTRVMVFVLVSIAVIATIAAVSVGLSHAQAIRENNSFIGSMKGHMSQANGRTASDMWTHMNATQHMSGSELDQCKSMHDAMNVTSHMMGPR